MSRSKVGPGMALLAGAALLGGAATAAAGPSTTPTVLDAAALDSVTAGAFQVGAGVEGAAGAQGGSGATAMVDFNVQGQAGPEGGSVLGIVRASGFALSSDELPAASFATTDGGAQGNVATRVRTANFNRQGSRYSISESITVAVGFSIAPIALPTRPEMPERPVF